MKPEQIRKLLGGYATGTLTGEERQALLEAALHNQKLFDALADEEALRELLSDEAYRRELVAMLSEKEPALGERLAAWWRRPASLAWAGGLAAALVAAVIVYQVYRPATPLQQIAMHRESSAALPEPASKPLAPSESAPEPQAVPGDILKRKESFESASETLVLAETAPGLPAPAVTIAEPGAVPESAPKSAVFVETPEVEEKLKPAAPRAAEELAVWRAAPAPEKREADRLAATPAAVEMVDRPAAPAPVKRDADRPAATPAAVEMVDRPAASPPVKRDADRPAATPAAVEMVDRPAAPAPVKRDADRPARGQEASRDKGLTQVPAEELMGFVGGRPTAAAEADVLEEGEARSDIEAAPPPAPRRQLAVKKYSSTEELKSAAADLRYSVERRNADGSYSEALGTEVFGLNDPIRLTIEAGASGRLQVLELTAAGASRILFSAPAVRGTRYTVPAEGNLPPPKSPGPRRLRLVLSTESRPRYSVGTTARGAEATADITAEVTLLYR